MRRIIAGLGYNVALYYIPFSHTYARAFPFHSVRFVPSYCVFKTVVRVSVESF